MFWQLYLAVLLILWNWNVNYFGEYTHAQESQAACIEIHFFGYDWAEADMIDGHVYYTPQQKNEPQPEM